VKFPQSRIVSRIPIIVSNELRSERTELELSVLTSFGAFLRGGICWLAIYSMGALAELLPIVHLLMPPFWIIIGPYAFLKIFKHFSHQLDYMSLNLKCLSCDLSLPRLDIKEVLLGASECPQCRSRVELKLEPGIDIRSWEQELKDRSEQESMRIIKTFPWPFNTVERAALLPSLIMHLSVLTFAAASFIAISWLGQQAYDLGTRSQEISTWKFELDFVAKFLILFTVVLICSKLFGRLFEKFGQPAVIGEVLAGIVLGPSLLGIWYPNFPSLVLASPAGFALRGMAEIGVILFVTLVGVDFNPKVFKSHAQTAFAISHGSILFPFIGGCLLSLLLFRLGAGPGVNFSVFSMFIGLAMSVTAFPVLARIVEDLKLESSFVGQLSLICASIDDVIAWLFLALALSLHRSQVQGFLIGIVGCLLFLVIYFRIVKPFILVLVRRVEAESAFQPKDFIQILSVILLVSLSTTLIGIHSIFGAFLVG
jgi:hypothetical protein